VFLATIVSSNVHQRAEGCSRLLFGISFASFNVQPHELPLSPSGI
jgi:hypothetical protein